MDPITLPKTANTVHYSEPVVMVIQIFLIDTYSIINLWGERFSIQIVAHTVSVDYANVGSREDVMSGKVGGTIYKSCF